MIILMQLLFVPLFFIQNMLLFSSGYGSISLCSNTCVFVRAKERKQVSQLLSPMESKQLIISLAQWHDLDSRRGLLFKIRCL